MTAAASHHKNSQVKNKFPSHEKSGIKKKKGSRNMISEPQVVAGRTGQRYKREKDTGGRGGRMGGDMGPHNCETPQEIPSSEKRKERALRVQFLCKITATAEPGLRGKNSGSSFSKKATYRRRKNSFQTWKWTFHIAQYFGFTSPIISTLRDRKMCLKG